MHKGSGASATRTSGVRYSNDLVMKSPSKSGKYANSRKNQNDKSYTVKKVLDQSINSLNSGKGANNQSFHHEPASTKKSRKQNADLDEQPVIVEDMP